MTGPIVTRVEDAPLVEWRAGVRTRLHAKAYAAPTALCVLEQWCDPGLGAPTHTHFETEEMITIVEGGAEVWVDAETTILAAGDSVLLPPHTWHGFRNHGLTTLHILAIFAAARPLVRYLDDEEGRVLQIASRAETLVDPHRAIHEPSCPPPH
jgi:mannose-6-phosphate isomerase-like protein (cupin superfamily)